MTEQVREEDLAAVGIKKDDVVYYHNKPDPNAAAEYENAKKLEGEGLASETVKPAKPVVVETPEWAIDKDAEKYKGLKCNAIENHLFSDEKGKVKVYLEITPDQAKNARFDINFDPFNLFVRVVGEKEFSEFVVADKPLNAEIIPSESSWRVNSKGDKLILSLKKKIDEFWPCLVKKEMNQHTGWNT